MSPPYARNDSAPVSLPASPGPRDLGPSSAGGARSGDGSASARRHARLRTADTRA